MNQKIEAEQPVVSEPVVDAGSDNQVADQAERQVPLSALEAERQKRQERDEENRYLRELATQQKAQLESMQQRPAAQDNSDEDLVNKRDLRQFKDQLSKEDFIQMKREIAEESFKDANPEAIRQIDMHLKEIIERKPWLAETIERAPNRYSRAYEIVQDYAPALKANAAAKQSKAEDAKRIVDNSKKPGTPAVVGKPANMSQGDYMKSMRGKKEFKDYRRELLQG
jgi:hypothetical protein